jgi:hypothetical protein
MFALSALAALSAPAMVISASPALAIDIPIGSGANLTRNTQIELQILESRQRRREFQNLQQQFRAEDRRVNQAGRQRLEIPQMLGSCSVQVRGSKFLRTCR